MGRRGRERRDQCIAALMALALVGCRGGPVQDPAALLQAAVAAHGGAEKLAQLDDLKVVSDVMFKGQMAMRRTVHWRGARTWAMALDNNGRVVMRLGLADGQCWTKDHHLVASCSGDEGELGRIAALFEARLLHHFDPSMVSPADPVNVNGVVSPALRAGKLVLVFDPTSHLLVQIHLENRIDTLSDYRSIGGAMIAAHRVLTIGGELDVDETWVQIEPGGADGDALRPPELPRAGLVIQEDDLPRSVSWMEIDEPGRDAQQAVATLDEFTRSQGRRPSMSEGVILIPPAEPGQRWRIAVGVEATHLSPIEVQGLHMEEWPAIRFLGIFAQGDSAAVNAQRAEVQRLLQERNLLPAVGAQWQILLPRDALDRPPAERLSLIRIAVS